ncbi:putative porin [Variovorax boronicumulans]|uniref:porin n=1 Tax=Variovorax boronicumulans TaxID=436515 RepID=UPI0027879F24|nr:porin [Variovorax boronicumulans]MDP9994584.1 putative porin [Variovorax boronicumulans]MDQ0005716.1 putative porin [Variovorax boronicumulans]MDQ0044351.1 putative porin [Variovorax boronicumulans]
MKKSFVALASLTAVGVASAQSSVTLFGVVDASVSRYSSTAERVGVNPFTSPSLTAPVRIKQSQTVLGNSGYNSSRVGFRGTEDLGGGLAASFWLEADISNDDGSKGLDNFNRRSTVSFSGGFGEVRLGRDYVPTFWNDAVFDPFGINGVGRSVILSTNARLTALRGPGAVSGRPPTDNYVRASNSIGYFLPAGLGGFFGQVQYAFPETIKNSGLEQSQRGRYVGGRFGYAQGPLTTAIAYGQSIAVDTPSIVTGLAIGNRQERKLNIFNVGASYDFGPVKLFGELSQVKDKNEIGATSALAGIPVFVNTSQTDKYNGALLGVTIPVGVSLIRVSYGRVKFDNGAAPAVRTSLFTTSNLDATANELSVGYVHNLSKRTALYATVVKLKIKDGQNSQVLGGQSVAQSNGTNPSGGVGTFPAGYTLRHSMGYDFGIRHAF